MCGTRRLCQAKGATPCTTRHQYNETKIMCAVAKGASLALSSCARRNIQPDAVNSFGNMICHRSVLAFHKVKSPAAGARRASRHLT